MSEPVFQSALGSVQGNSNRAERSWNDGALNVGEVKVMHHKRATADTAVLGASNEIRSTDEQEGRNACVVCSRYAGFDELYQKPYGEFIPYQSGDRPVIVYCENKKSQPIIVGTLHHTDEDVGDPNTTDILPSGYPVDPENRREALRQIWIHRSQDGFTIEGENGEFEISSHTKSFVKSGSLRTDEETFDYEDLALKDKISIAEGHPKTINLPEEYCEPLKFFAVFRNRYADDETDYLRMCVDASKAAFKWLQQKPGPKQLTYAELEENGAYRLRRQQNAVQRGGGTNYSEMLLRQDGVLQARRVTEARTVECELGSDGLHTAINGSEVTADITAEEIRTCVQGSEVRQTADTVSVTVGGAVIQAGNGQILLTVGGSRIQLSGGAITINAGVVNIN